MRQPACALGPLSKLSRLAFLSIAALASLALAPGNLGAARAASSSIVSPAVSRGDGMSASQGHSVTYDRYSLMIDGHRVVLYGGEYQFWRTPSPDRWPLVLAEMRAAGLNEVTVGVSWQFQSPSPGHYDFSGIRDLGRFLDDAAAAGLYVIARPGPAYNSESSASSLPGWLLTRATNLRDNRGHAYCGADAPSPVYAAAYTDWFRHVLPIIASRQLTTGHGSVVALQIENEYSPRCGTLQYMRELHDLARELGITVPLLANNNTCCAPTGSWRVPGDDGEPIVDLPAEDDYPCPGTCGPNWNASIFRSVDSLEKRMRGAGVTTAPIAVAELQGGYFTGWHGPSYARLGDVYNASFLQSLDGSVLGQGATLVSTYMVAGGTSWGYMAGPNTVTSYDYAAPIHEWGAPSPSYDGLKLTGMFVDAFGDALAATRRVGSVTASQPDLLYAARQEIDGPQRGARLIVLRNADPHRARSTRLWLEVDGQYESIPQQGDAIHMGPHALYLLLAGLNLGPHFRLRYSTSRPLTVARVNGEEILVLYGGDGTPGETALAFAHRPRILRADAGITATYEARAGQLVLDYQHQEGPRYVLLDAGGHRLLLVLTGPKTAAHTWRVETGAGEVLLIGPSMAYATVGVHGGVTVETVPGAATSFEEWAPGTGRSAILAAGGDNVAPRAGGAKRARQAAGADMRVEARYDDTLGASIGSLDAPEERIALPTLTRWRFMAGSPETAPSFDDAHWTRATERATTNPNVPAQDTLLADDYGFHYGFVWYRGRFKGTGLEQSLRLYARNSYSVWLNGRYLGSSTLDNDIKNVNDQLFLSDPTPSNATYADGLFYRIPRGLVRRGATNVIAVLVESLGHNSGFSNGERARSPFGILDAELLGGAHPPAISWRIQGADGGDNPLNASGLYGERNGWYRTGYDDSRWPWVSVPDRWTSRGLHLQGVGWYRTAFDLDLPRDEDVPLGLAIPSAQDKVVIWLNGLLIGRYWEGVGPQHVFYLPAGLLNEHGRNVLALAVWNRGDSGGLTGGVSLQPYTESANATIAPAG